MATPRESAPARLLLSALATVRLPGPLRVADQPRVLANDLATHPAKLEFAIFHFPMYSDNATETTDTYLRGPNSLAALLTQYGVQFVFNGQYR